MMSSCLASTGSEFIALAGLVAGVLIAAGVVLVYRNKRRPHVTIGLTALALLCAVTIGVSMPSTVQAAEPVALGIPCPIDTPDASPVQPAPVGASIGDFAWIDANRNSLQDVGELPAVGAQLTLLDFATGAPVTIGVGGAAIAPTQTTDANGAFLFSQLLPGSYRIVVESVGTVLGESVYISVSSYAPGPPIDTSQPVTADIADANGVVVASYTFSFAPGDSCSFGVDNSMPSVGHSVRVLNGTTDITASSAVAVSMSPAALGGEVVPAGAGDGAIDSDFDPMSRATVNALTVVEGEQLLTVDIGFEPSVSGPVLSSCV